MSELKDTLEGLTGKKRRFLLYRIAGLDRNTAIQVIDVPQGRLNVWLHDQKFVDAHRKIDELGATHRAEAMRAIRRDNQMGAAMLEKEVVDRMREELDTGDYRLVKTNLGKAVYERLMNELDKSPSLQVNTWEQRIALLNSQPENPQLEEGDVIDADYSQAETSQKPEYQESSTE
jgi:hypothetical protein